MFVALNNKGERVLSNKAVRGRYYYCQQCQGRLVFKKGRIKLPHFAHYPNQAPCTTWERESSRHLEMKYVAMRNLVKDNRVGLAEYEYNIDGYFPDLYMEIIDYNGKHWKMAVEMQKSSKSVDDILEKTRFYTERDIYTLWVFDFPQAWIKKVSRINRKLGHLRFFEVRVNAMLRELHRLSVGRFYVMRNDMILATHLYPVYRNKKKWNRYMEDHYIQRKNLKTIKKPVMKVLGNWNVMFTTTEEGLKIARFRDKQFWED